MRISAEKLLRPENVLLAWGLLTGATAAATRWWRKRLSTNWPACQGSISNHSIRTEGHHYMVEIIYSYSVNGEYYSGFLEHAALTRKKAERFADKFPAGMMLVIRFNPAKPEVSVARLDDQPGHMA